MPLQSFVDSASSMAVVNGAVQIKANHLTSYKLLAPTNPLGENSSNAVKAHLKTSPPGRKLTSDEVKTYLASSSILHTLDGWAYLSHSIESLLKGDNGIAIHLAYYAELRSTMSFLASEGIGVFDSQHICINNGSQIIANPVIKKGGNKANSGTHQFTWDAIEKWSNSTVKPSSTDLLKVFSVNNKTFEEWSQAFPYPSTIIPAQIIQKWLRNWNFDVKFFRNDRHARNEVSYRPQRLKIVPNKYSLNEVIEKLNSFWNLLEPSSNNRFQELDKFLLRIYLQEYYAALSPAIKNTNSLEDLIISTITNLGLNHEQSFIDFLKDNSAITHPLFVESANDTIDPSTGCLNPLSVIARATLMLRISTGNTSMLYQNAGINKAELNFLWESFGNQNGFWEPTLMPSDFEELWLDIKEYIEETVEWAKTKRPSLCLSVIYSDNAVPLSFNYFKQFHRAALWGLNI